MSVPGRLHHLTSSLQAAAGTAAQPPRGPSLTTTTFMLNDDETHLNHASYGTVPRMVLQKQFELMMQTEANPDTWFRHSVGPLWDEAIAAAATLVDCDPDDMVFVKNATAGVNAVVRQLQLGPGDACLIADQTYGACANTVRDACTKAGAECISLQTGRDALVSDDIFAAALEQQLTAAPHIKFALLDHITSPSAVLLPVARLCAICHKHDVRVMVDGAHAPNIPGLGVASLGADWYTGNFHKWCFAPKGCAFLWVAKPMQEVAQGVVISHQYQNEDWKQRFKMQGTLDNTAYFAMPVAKQFIDMMGGQEAIYKHNHELLRKGANRLVEAWGTELLVPLEKCSTMAVVRNPLDSWAAEGVNPHELLWDRYKIRVAGGFEMPGVEGVWSRISAQVYNDEDDYERLAQAVLELKAEKEAEQTQAADETAAVAVMEED